MVPGALAASNEAAGLVPGEVVLGRGGAQVTLRVGARWKRKMGRLVISSVKSQGGNSEFQKLLLSKKSPIFTITFEAPWCIP